MILLLNYQINIYLYLDLILVADMEKVLRKQLLIGERNGDKVMGFKVKLGVYQLKMHQSEELYQ